MRQINKKNSFSLIILTILALFHVNISAETLGNGLTPSAIYNTRTIDPDGITYLKSISSRTPSGLLYKSPYSPKTVKQLNSNWRYISSIEFGYLINDGKENAARFNDYKDWHDGPLINLFDFSVWNKDQGYFIDASGNGVGRDDQYYQLTTGQYGKSKIKVFYNQVPHKFSQNAVTIFNGVGTENLTLPSALTPGSNSNDQIQQALQSAYQPNLFLNRKKAGINVEYKPLFGVKLFADFTHKSRKGKRPFGGSFFPPFYTGGNAGGVIETIEPIDYSTNEISSGLSYADAVFQLNLKYNGSFFVNKKGQLTFENPFTNLPGTEPVKRGRIDLYPDNDFHQIMADVAYQLPLQGQLFSSFSWSRMRQNDTLIPPTLNSGLNFTGINLEQWNTTNALSRKTADAEIDNLLLQVGAQILPLQYWTVRTNLRLQNENNKTDYTAFNPTTRQFGYIGLDGAEGGSVFNPDVTQTPIHFRNIPFEKKILQGDFDTDYRITRKTKLGLKYQYQQINYTHRERNKTKENSLITYVSSRSLPWATLRLSYRYADRDGSEYRYNPNSDFFTSSLSGFKPVLATGPVSQTLAELRKFDLSSRKQNTVKAQANFLLNDEMDLLLSSKWTKNNYQAQFGLQKEQSASVNMEWNYQPSSHFNSYAFYSFQHHKKKIANINDTGFSTDPHAGGKTFPFSAAWSESSYDNNHFLGLGIRYIFNQFEIDSSYSYNWSNNQVNYLKGPHSGLDLSDTKFPEIKYSQHSLETSVRWHIHKNSSIRFYHRFEQSNTTDWHFDNLTPLIDNQLFLNATPEDYAIHQFGLFFQYRM